MSLTPGAGCRWTGIYAYSPSTNKIIESSTGACVRLRSAEKDEKRQQQMFGECGVAPKYFRDVPTTVCMEDQSRCKMTLATDHNDGSQAAASPDSTDCSAWRMSV